MSKKVLIVTPKFPYPPYGACEQDRAAGVELFLKNGWEVRVITKIYGEEYRKEVDDVSQKLGIKIIPIVYKYLHGGKKCWRRLLNPRYWDGAAFEYSDPEIKNALIQELNEFQPNVVWFDYTYLWPLYRIVKDKEIPIITRSINFEPAHFLDEDGRNFINYLKTVPKLLSEYFVSQKSDVLFAITPKESRIYQKMGAKKVVVLPLRGLPRCLDWSHKVADKKVLNVFFAGSTYNVSHNRAALEFLLKKVVPQTKSIFPGQFKFHVFGRKIPDDLNSYFNDNIINHQYLEEPEYLSLLSEMDIAIVPSLYGAGMQQKIFEPLARGFPTVTSARGLAGYPFKEGRHLFLAQTAEEFVKCLGALKEYTLRESLSRETKSLSRSLFSESVLEKIIFDSINVL